MLDERDMELLRALFREEGDRIEKRFQEQDERIDERITRMFREQDERIEKRFQEQDERIEKRFQEQDERIEKRFQEQDERINTMFREQNEWINTMFREQRRSIMHDVQVLMDAEFKPRFNLLAEDLQIIREKMIPEERVEEAEADIQVLKTSVRILNEDVRELKKAQ